MRRSRFEIVADISQTCISPRRKTRIMCEVKLNLMQANEYLSQLTSLGLLFQEKDKYKTTDKGRRFISAYNRLGEIIGVPPSVTDRNESLKPFSVHSPSILVLFCVCGRGVC